MSTDKTQATDHSDEETAELEERQRSLAVKRGEVERITQNIEAEALHNKVIGSRIDRILYNQVERISRDIEVYDEIVSTRDGDDLVRINGSNEVISAEQAAARRNLLLDDLIKIKKAVVDEGRQANTQVNVGINMNDVISDALANLKDSAHNSSKTLDM